MFSARQQWRQFQADSLVDCLNGRTLALAQTEVLGELDLARRLRRLRVSVIYWWRHGRWPNLDQPQRFTEWVQWRKLNDRSPLRAAMTDKLRSKELAAERLGVANVVPTIWSGRELPTTAPSAFPLVVKSNHGCNQVRIVRNPDDWEVTRAIAPRWLEGPYGAMLDEWHYGDAERTLIVEPFVGSDATTLPLDYKVYVFGGAARIVQLHVGRGEKHRWTQFDRNWVPVSDDPIDAPPPPNLAAMLAAAERLASGHDFLRVDFYNVDGKLWFGEFCLFPGSGLDKFRPNSLDIMLGKVWADARQPLNVGPLET